MNMQQANQFQYRIRINYFIKVPQVRLILADGTPGGIMNTSEALILAQEQNLDLVEINPKTSPPLCKLINFGKYKYEEKKKQAESKKNQKNQEIKEITFRPNTDENDLNHKTEQAKQFLNDGNKVKFTIRFRGREIVHPQVGKDRLEWVFNQLSGLIQSVPFINLDGKLMSAIVVPKK